MKIVDIIIPCYNEENNVKLIYKKLNENLPHLKYKFNFLFINDGSNDGTLKELITLKEDLKVKIISFSRNYGKEQAIMAGIDYSNNDAAIIIDADLQMDPSYINDMLKIWEEGINLVLSKKEKRKKGIKSFLAKNYYKVYKKIANERIQQDVLDFQLMDKTVLNEIKKYREKNRFFKGITAEIGFKYKIIEIKIDERKEGESKFSSYKSLFKYALTSITAYSTMPLKISIYLGFIIASISFIYMFITILRKIFNQINVEGYTSILVIILFLFGLVFLILGIIGYYIALILDEVKNRPNYIVEEKHNV